ncbi:xanthine dehydrogenase small subunit [Sphingobium boeckii]|uniref:Xanthine dehydrogenase small subunit n=1 Tax=Sphingobium boeckii TaxID=1082345 RepID=A0A7W9EE72_9SPHN|nr:xanthine dehydrogenase small subunit [Sphingobium boeckii]MBB5685714.1 xanthine dehydrogenase small subunit [Sphingobium boeckii]
MSVRFLLDGEIVEITDVDPTSTILNYLRYRLRRTGTKEGCAEGDCGACTVLLGELDEGAETMRWRSVNACILFLPMLDGKALLTVESLAVDGKLNPLQACMAENGSSQCGFCTPGFVMSLYGRTIGASGHDLPVADVVAGNLCRCTGYGPILAAGDGIGKLSRDDQPTMVALREMAETACAGGVFEDRRWFAPRTPEALAGLLAAHPDARIIAGATDVGLWVTKGLKTIETMVFIGNVAGMKAIVEDEAGVTLGAGVPYADAHAAFSRLHPDLGELVRRIGGLQVRNAGTIGGNIANGSPIGDGPPALIALGAELTLCSTAGRRTMPLENFFLDYGRQDRQPGEYVESLWIPRPAPQDIIHISKLSRRFDSDISAVCGAFALTVENGLIVRARIAFGGMAATPCRASGCEAALVGKPFAAETIASGTIALAGDFSPITDVRGTATYRAEVAANLLWRLWYRAQGEDISVLALESSHG